VTEVSPSGFLPEPKQMEQMLKLQDVIYLLLRMVKYQLRILIEKTASLNNHCNAINRQTNPTYFFDLAEALKKILVVFN
jgi:hypothetical protein